MDDIEAAAKMANAHDFIMAFPRGYRTMVTDKCALPHHEFEKYSAYWAE